jgi:GTP-binding protein
MRVLSADFVTSAFQPEQYPRDKRPEVAFVGRSNVGKSTLLNVLLHRKGLAKTSKKPGKTRSVNFFDINGTVYFVDLPGYGFARVAKSLRESWGGVITNYISGRKTLCLVVHLIDARHGAMDNDLELLELIEEARAPTLLVATKVDQLRTTERLAALDRLRGQLDLDADALVVPFSAISKEGIREVWRVIDDSIPRPARQR